jgi:hypothetical protein
MKLQEFISETLVQIINGVKDAQGKIGESGAVNPIGINRMKDQLAGRGYHSGAVTETVEFDVAVTVTEDKTKKVGAGAIVSVVGLGAQMQTEAHSSSVSRVRFSVQALLPPGKDFRDSTKPQTPKGRKVTSSGYSATHW